MRVTVEVPELNNAQRECLKLLRDDDLSAAAKYYMLSAEERAHLIRLGVLVFHPEMALTSFGREVSAALDGESPEP